MKTMSSPPQNRLRRLNIRLTQPEWDRIQQLSSQTTCRSVSDYSRKVLLEKPVKVFYRNQSFDEFEERMALLRPLLELCCESLLSRLEQFKYTIPDIDLLLDLLNAADKFVRLLEEVKNLIDQLYNKCAQ
jgi:hypothetical protein